MLKLDELLVCPVCHTDLTFDLSGQASQGSCRVCGRRFLSQNNVFDLTPVPPPDSDVAEMWHIWENLQNNGLVAYEQDPEHNLSVGKRQDVKAFAEFCNLSGLTLDIGCGPQSSIPSYANAICDRYIGIDPLIGVQPRDFTFVKCIAEYLPFRPATFDHILFATSLDHMLSPKRALQETKRLLKPNGTINIWFFDTTKRKRKGLLSIWKARSRFAMTLLKQGKTKEFVQRLVRRFPKPPRAIPNNDNIVQPNTPAYLADLSIPTGAIDHFHFFHPTQAEAQQWLQEIGLKIVKTKIFNVNHVFVQAKI